MALLWGYLLHPGSRDLDKLVGRIEPRLRVGPPLGAQHPQDGDFVARLELRTAQAVLPGLQRQDPALDHVEPDLPEKVGDVSKSKHGIELVLFGLLHQRRDHLPPDAVRLGVFVYGERADLPDRRRVEVQRPAAEELVAAVNDREIADRFRHLELGPGEHDALGGIPVNEGKNWRNVVHDRLSDGQPHSGRCRFDKRVRVDSADHAALPSAGTIRVPASSPARILGRICSTAPGAIRTVPTPPSSAANAAFNFACMPPVATPSAISCRLAAAVSTGRTAFEASMTPGTSVRNTSCSTPNADAHATAIWSAFTL